jgi:glycosyltransferase involved in cell wall biosynthesis
MLRRVCLVPKLAGVGGMVSFQGKLAVGLAQRSIDVVYDLAAEPYEAVLVIGGTRDLGGLWRARRRGIPVVQRLNGMNWVHRRRRTGLRHALRAEYGNWLLAAIRRRLATRIVYQSNFTHAWWERVYGPTRQPWQVTYNGVDLAAYSPYGPEQPPENLTRLLVVEGNLGGGYEMGLEQAVELAERLQAARGGCFEVLAVGRIAPALQAEWQARLAQAVGLRLTFTGIVPREQIPSLARAAHLLYAADLHPACPNAVIEALACGLPVAAFATGALAELVTGDAGRVSPYGSDPWRIEKPDLPALAIAAGEILDDQPRFRRAARQRAEAAFGLDAMVAAYLAALSA